MAEPRSDLDIAIANARLDPPDDRGLMPLDTANEIVKNARTFASAKDAETHELWAALLSLPNAKEFVRHAKRLKWEDEPAADTVLAPHDRYGDDIFPWIEEAVADNELTAVPLFLPELLIEIGSRPAFDLVFELERVDGSSQDAALLFREWVEIHPELAFAQLADRAEFGEPRARKLFRHLANLDPDTAFKHVAKSRGEEDAEALFEALCIVRHLAETSVLSIFDLSAEGEMDAPDPQWPMFHSDRTPATIYHAMRLIAVRERSGNDWGVLIERIGGSAPDNAVVEPYVYGSNVVPGLAREACRPIEITMDRPADEEGFDGVTVEGAAGKLVLSNKMMTHLGLRQRGLGSLPPDQQAFVMTLRAYHGHHPNALFTEPAQVAALTKVDGPHDVVLVSESHAHVLGTAFEVVTRRDKFWQVRPSDTRVFRSLARAIVERDGSLFRPGKSNLDWREHPLPRNLAFEPV